jgi:cation:H+ antiporter
MDLGGLFLAGVTFVASIWLMVEGAEKLTESFLRISITFGVSTFLLGYVLSGIDAENLAVGIAGALGQMHSIALGTVVGSAVFLLTFAVGTTAVIAPLHSDTPRRLLALTLTSPLPFALLALDGELSRLDGLILLAAAFVLIGYVVQTARTHPLMKPNEHKIGKALRPRPRWWAPLLVVGATVAIVIGAHLFEWSVKRLLAILGWHASWFGMIVVAAAVSFEEVPRMLVPARRGHAEISIGNILGTVAFFVLFNVGLIALIQPLVVEPSVLRFYWPAMMAALGLVILFLWRGRIARIEGVVLLVLYAVYVVLAIASDLWPRA